MSNFVDKGLEPPSFTERFDGIEAQLRDLSAAVAFMLAAMTKQPAQLSDAPALLDRLGREMPGNILPANGILRQM